MSGIESDGAPKPPIGQPAAGNESWSAEMPAVQPHPTWYQPVRIVGPRRGGRVLAAAGAAAAVVIGAVAVAVIGLPRFSFLHAGSPPKPSPPLTAAQVVLIASRQSARLNWVSATFTGKQRGPMPYTIAGVVTEQRIRCCYR